MKEVRKWYVAQTHINCLGEATVSFLSYRDNWQVGLHWSSQFKNPDMIFCDTREEAINRKANNDDCTVHGHYMMVEEVAAG